MTLELIASLSALFLAVLAAVGYIEQRTKNATIEGRRREQSDTLKSQADKLDARVGKLEDAHGDARVVQAEILGDIKNLIALVTKLSLDFEDHMRLEQKPARTTR
jgi:hypothetical protein